MELPLKILLLPEDFKLSPSFLGSNYDFFYSSLLPLLEEGGLGVFGASYGVGLAPPPPSVYREKPL